MKFTPGQHVISNGTLYIYRHDCTAHGDPPRNLINGTPAHCVYALVNLPGSNHPIVVHRSSLKKEGDAPTPPTPPMADVQTSSKRHFLSTPAKAITTPRFDVLASLKADALDAQAERLENYAMTLRGEAGALRRGEG